MITLPPPIAPESFDDANAALTRIQDIYRSSQQHLISQFKQYLRQEHPSETPRRVRAFYPCIRLRTQHWGHPDSRLAYGFVAGAGEYSTTLTRPRLFADYLRQQLQLLLGNHRCRIEVAVSDTPMPLPFSFAEDDSFERQLKDWQRASLRDVFDMPQLSAMDDAIANGTHACAPGQAAPLALFTAPRIDYSLYRLRHYTGTSPRHFQNFVLFTNYAFYVDEFLAYGQAQMAHPDSPYTAFVEPGNVVTRRAIGPGRRPVREGGTAPARAPQMPTYHLVREGHSGITLVNIGVGPSNARNITDHIAVLRPHVWIMVGHCAGLRTSQRLGDYVLAHAYVRADHVLDEELPPWVPLPALAEVQIALQDAVAEITGLHGHELKRVLRTGTVATTANRNWELDGEGSARQHLSQSRAVALDMESATIAANGFRFRVPYGTLLCVSDKPLHGDIKLPGMANDFYHQRVAQHLQIGIRALEHLRQNGLGSLHSRKLRSFAEVAFQ